MLVATLAYAVIRVAQRLPELPTDKLIGGDFINMWSAAQLLLDGDLASIYDHEALMAFQQTVVHAFIGLRLWAYPPHSLLLIWPLGFLSYIPALVVWSAIGLAVLAWGARRAGLTATETAIVLLSPASLYCVDVGQTGNVATGLMLVALFPRAPRAAGPIVAAALLTVKPQIGFLLPLVWGLQRRWVAIAATGALALALVLLATLLFGTETWRGYLTDTLPALDGLERYGRGPFTWRIPSAFMSFRILTGDGDLAIRLHLVFAALVGAWLVWRLVALSDAVTRAALVLVGTTLITPYIHAYDLNLLLCGALLVLRLHPERAGIWVAVAWALPLLLEWLNIIGIPIAPLLILPLFALAGARTSVAPRGEASEAAAGRSLD